MKTLEQLRAQFGDIADFLTSEIGERFDQVETSLTDLAVELQNRPPEQVAALREDIKEMIEFVTKRSEAADSERFKYLQSSLQIIGFTLVIFSLGLTAVDKIATWSPAVLSVLLSFSFSLFVAASGALIIVVMYFAQARFRYPFIYYTQLGNAWRWFYYANIRPDTPEGEFIYRNSAYQQKYAHNYADGLETYAHRYVNDPVPRQTMDDLRQLFLLMAHDRYKQRFKQHMVHAALYTGFIAAAAFLGGLLGSAGVYFR